MRKYKRAGYDGIFVEALGERFYIVLLDERVFLCESTSDSVVLEGEVPFEQFATVADYRDARRWIEAGRWEG